MKHLTVVLILALTLAGPALAEEESAETRFHEAYVQEVIDGDVAPAAKTYLALMEDETTPLGIRAESRFRFAVCTVLLGRADEGRVQLVALIADAATPAILRAKAEEYRTSIAGLGAGSELERKLQSLVFDLGRVVPHGAVAVHRDFEIIGPPAIPFLRKLLTHTDMPLRRHAYRLLCRMGAKGMGEAWTMDLLVNDVSYNSDIANYLNGRPEERAAFERRLLALTDEELRRVSNYIHPWPSLSGECVHQVVQRPEVRGLASSLLAGSVRGDEQQTLLLRWLASEDPGIRDTARGMVLQSPDLVQDEARRSALFEAWLRSEDPETRHRVTVLVLRDPALLPDPMDSDHYRAIVHNAPKSGGLWYRGSAQDKRAAVLARVSDAQSAPTLLAALTDVVEEGCEPGTDGHYRKRGPLTYGLADLIATSLEQKPVAEIDLDAYAEVLKRWGGIWPKAFTLDKGTQYVPTYPPERYWSHLEWVLRHLPAKEADALAQWVVEETTRQMSTELGKRALYYLLVFKVGSPGALRYWHAALQVAKDPEIHKNLMQRLPMGDDASSKETKRAFVLMLPTLLPDLSDSEVATVATALPWRVDEMEREEAIDAVTAFVRAVLRRSPKSARVAPWVPSLIAGLSREETLAYATEIWPAVIMQVWSDLSEEDRKEALTRIYSYAGYLPGVGVSGPPEIGAFLREHLGAPGTDWKAVARRPSVFPLVTWVPLAPESAVSDIVGSVGRGGIQQVIHTEEALDAAAREMTRDLAKVNPTVLEFVRRRATSGVRDEILDYLLASGPPELRRRILTPRVPGPHGAVGTAKGLEAALDALLAEDPVDLELVRIAATQLEPLDPTLKIEPAARLLLDSTERADVLAGIHLAESLALGSLSSKLRELYVSTRDSRIRTAARKAIHAIDHLGLVRAGVEPP